MKSMKITISSGTTLIELLISSTIVAALLIGVVGLASMSFSIRGRTHAALTVNENLQFAFGRISGSLVEATGILTPPLGSTSSTLALTTSASSTNPTIIQLADGIITITQGTSTISTLTSREIEVIRLNFTRVSSTTPGVRIVAVARLRESVEMPLSVTTTVMIRR